LTTDVTAMFRDGGSPDTAARGRCTSTPPGSASPGAKVSDLGTRFAIFSAWVLRLDPELTEVGQAALDEAGDGLGTLVRVELAVGVAGVVVDERAHPFVVDPHPLLAAAAMPVADARSRPQSALAPSPTGAWPRRSAPAQPPAAAAASDAVVKNDPPDTTASAAARAWPATSETTTCRQLSARRHGVSPQHDTTAPPQHRRQAPADQQVRDERYGEAPSGSLLRSVSLRRPTASKEARMTYSAVHNVSRHVI